MSSDVFGIVAATTVVLSLVPQAVQVLRSGRLTGLSTTSAAAAAASCAAWAVYAQQSGLTVAVISSSLGVLLWGVIAAVPMRREQDRPSLWVAMWALAIVVVTVLGGAEALGVLLVGEALTYTLPQARRVRRSTQGVSTATWLLTAASASGWVAYGFGAGDPAIGVANLLKLAVCGSIAATLLRDRRPRKGLRDDGGVVGRLFRVVAPAPIDGGRPWSRRLAGLAGFHGRVVPSVESAGWASWRDAME